MRDFPMFTTDFGVVSLILKQIPYRQQAYIRVLDVQPDGLKPMLEECVSFCRMAGAEQVYVTGHTELQELPLYTKVLKMRGQAWVEKEKLRNLFPVTEQTVGIWRKYYNERMQHVDNAAYLESRDEAEILSSGGAYFVHEDGNVLGIGWLEGTKLLAVAGLCPGAGERVMHSLMSLVEGETMTIEVASTNAKAIRLYEKLGFVAVEEISCWYKVL